MNADNMNLSTDDALANAGRRTIMRKTGLSVAGLAAAGALGAGGFLSSARSAEAAPAAGSTAASVITPTQSATNDIAILNFALNLEYLEASFYLQATQGVGLSSSITTGNTPVGTVSGGALVPFTNPIIQQYAFNIAADEQAHVNFLFNALTATNAASIPNINIGTAFTTLAVAAGLISQGQTFNPYADEISFLLGAFIFEDVGVTAYNGALPYITTANLTYASSIMAVEAYHAATIRTLLSDLGAGVAVQAISNLRAAISQANDDAGILMPNGAVNIVPTDANGLAYTRTPTQVQSVVCGGAGNTSGLFFPNGLAVSATS